MWCDIGLMQKEYKEQENNDLKHRATEGWRNEYFFIFWLGCSWTGEGLDSGHGAALGPFKQSDLKEKRKNRRNEKQTLDIKQPRVN